jgi:hypothetical protein
MKKNRIISRRRLNNACHVILFIFFFLTVNQIWAQSKISSSVPTLEQVLNAKQDLWGLAAMNQPNGPSYNFFADLIPPLRYVNADFRHYPIVLCAPGSLKKARLISNGSGVNATAMLKTWKETGTVVLFTVNGEEELFGSRISSLDGPHCQKGYLPIIQMNYNHGKSTFNEETFASVDWSEYAVLFMRFILKKGEKGIIRAQIKSDGPLQSKGNTICDSLGNIVVSFDNNWQWDKSKNTLTANLNRQINAKLVIASVPVPASLSSKFAKASDYSIQKEKCVSKWEGILSDAMQVNVPEPIVNNAWKSVIIGNLELLKGNHMNYSAGNLYETMYEAESGDAVRSLLLWGLSSKGRDMIPPLLDYGNNKGLRFHDAAFKLQLLAHYFWLTHDKEFVRQQKTRWSSCIKILTDERDGTTGLLPKESYCGDEHQMVFSLNSNANAWRGLRDIASVLKEMGENEEYIHTSKIAATLYAAVQSAMYKSEYRNLKPSFIPVALFGEEKPYEMLTSTRRGSYYNLIIPYVIGSEIFSGTEREASMLRYLEENGGICMGMIRFDQHSGLFANENGLDDIYSLRYVDALLRRDEPERAIVSFYGKLAQGMTRETFLSAEGTSLRSLDEYGRPMYMPPTCAGSLFLWQLRSMLVQDYDLDNNGEPETLRLLFATPRTWLENGKTISVENAPTAFGEVSVRVESKLSSGKVIAQTNIPLKSSPLRTLLRIRLPSGWKINSVQSGSNELQVDDNGTVDISKLTGKNTVQFNVTKI